MDWEVLAHGYGLAEAPTIDTDGSLVFSDVLGGGIYRIDGSGAVSTVVPKRRGVGGIAIHADGGIVCSGRDVVHVRADGETRTVLHVDGVAGWNDLCTDATGRVYAGALRFAVFDPKAEEVPGELWRVAPDGDADVVFGDVVHANGVACQPRRRHDLHERHAPAARRRVRRRAAPSRREFDLSAHGHPDGMALDEHGAVWVALVSGGIARLTPDGDVDRTLEPPSAFTTSLCFAGRDLYVTTGGHADPELEGCVLRTTARRRRRARRPGAGLSGHDAVTVETRIDCARAHAIRLLRRQSDGGDGSAVADLTPGAAAPGCGSEANALTQRPIGQAGRTSPRRDRGRCSRPSAVRARTGWSIRSTSRQRCSGAWRAALCGRAVRHPRRQERGRRGPAGENRTS